MEGGEEREGGGVTGAGSKGRGGGGGGDEDALHNWRQQGSSICMRREKEAAWNGGALVQHCRCC